MWELSSPSEATKAAVLLASSYLTHRHRSLAEARQLPQGIGGGGWVAVHKARTAIAVLDSSEAQRWELSSPSEATKAAVLLASSYLTHRHRSLAEARQLPQGIGGGGWVAVHKAHTAIAVPDSSEAQRWELSSPSEATKAAVLLAFSLPDPPPSQPR
ncbi:hypothetical protein AO064_17455 [Pseudomonas marginalis]|uniref:Uncharacterized protein n=1 Tax=Pseudomonas marginalis TaxID=298 RepID=A0A9X5KYN3_PSEMA|nr:hypothetical protein AO064_17455 [Pseudomonas marginalis]